MMLSVVIPAHNEEGCIEATVSGLYSVLVDEGIDHEIVVVDDHCSDGTAAILNQLSDSVPTLTVVTNEESGGFGMAIRAGLDAFTGDCVAPFMADSSDDPADLVRFYRTMEREGTDCVFGTRFSRGGRVIDYPQLKLTMNRGANLIIRLIFGMRYDDVTNAFKLYRREVIDGVRPLVSKHFNLTVEIPLKAIVRGYSYRVVPNSWTNRSVGESKFNVPEMGSRYLFIVLYCFLERWLSRGDYERQSSPGPAAGVGESSRHGE